jgi:hypothetical protein
MKVNDFLLYTIDGDATFPGATYAAEIVSIDAANAFFTCRRPDTGQQLTVQYSTNTSGPWAASDDQGNELTLDTHDIYTAAATDPAPQGLAVVTFADGARHLCAVDSVSPTLDVTFYNPPYFKISFDGWTIAQSNWDVYPAGSAATSFEGFVLDNDLAQPAATGVFTNGWWSLARQMPANPGRVGGPIAPFAVVVHTTDMAPETFTALINSWTTSAGQGDCAHFVIGRDASDGVVQLIPITSNGNHAGGPGHGSFVAGQQSWHPNLVSVGIEVHCAGAVQQIDGAWRLVEGGVPQGNPIPDDDVTPDPQRPGRGWHTVTDYQYEQLGALLDGLETVLGALPAGCVATSVEAPPAYGVFPTGRRVGHVSLDAAHRGDPWPPTCDWVRARPLPAGV